MNARHSPRENVNIGPPGFFESRTAISVPPARATSTQLSPFPMLYVLLRHEMGDGSIRPHNSSIKPDTYAIESSMLSAEAPRCLNISW
jgi:hypothetical protein